MGAKAQRAAQAIVRSAKFRPSSDVTRSASAISKRHKNPKQMDQLTIPAAPLPIVNPVTALHDDLPLMIPDNSSRRGFDIFAAAAKVHAYQAKLLEVGQAHMNVAFEFSHRLAAIRSPLEFPSVIAEFTGKRIAMLSQHTKELVELSAKHS